MFPSEKIENLKDLFEDCVKCGMCQAVCPVFKAEGGEENSSRGRLALMKLIASGELPLDDYTVGLLNRCAGCASCEFQCLNGVEYLKLLAAARRKMNKEKRSASYKKDYAGRFRGKERCSGSGEDGGVLHEAARQASQKGERPYD